jgi:hypothetical protein
MVGVEIAPLHFIALDSSRRNKSIESKAPERGEEESHQDLCGSLSTLCMDVLYNLVWAIQGGMCDESGVCVVLYTFHLIICNVVVYQLNVVLLEGTCVMPIERACSVRAWNPRHVQRWVDMISRSTPIKKQCDISFGLLG